MLHVARSAFSANRFAPLSTRQPVAQARLRGLFGANMLMWIDALSDHRACGVTVDSVNDLTTSAMTITQATAAKRPLKAASSNVAVFGFDGVDDALLTSSTTWSVQDITIISLHALANATPGIIIERGLPSYGTTTAGAIQYGSTTQGANGLFGNVGGSYRIWTSSQPKWSSIISVLRRSAALGSEVVSYQNAALVSAFTDQGNANNTDNFGSSAMSIGSRNNGGSLPMQGQIVSIIVLNRQVSAAEAVSLNTLIRQRAGVA